MSLTQENWWNLQKRAPERTTFNSTIGMYMKGYIDLSRLTRAFNTLLQRHSVFRTRFVEDLENGGIPAQIIMDDPKVRFEAVPVADRAAAERGFADVNNSEYGVWSGDTLKLVDFYWAADEHILIVAYNPLVMDGWTYERLFVELAQLYDGGAKASLPPAPQYHDFALRQRARYEQGGMEEDMDYWLSVHEPRAPALPVLALEQARRGADPATRTAAVASWKHHTAKMRVASAVAAKIREASRRAKATPMQFYLTAYQSLLARLGGEAADDVVVEVADANRPDLDDLSTFGPYVSMLPVRLSASGGRDGGGDAGNDDDNGVFSAALGRTKELVRAALQHSRVPTHVLLQRLGRSSETEPLFRAVFDYKQGQAESGRIGEATMEGVLADRAGTPHDITLEMSDDPTKEPLVTFKLNTGIYGAGGVEVVMQEYMKILSAAVLDQGCRMR